MAKASSGKAELTNTDNVQNKFLSLLSLGLLVYANCGLTPQAHAEQYLDQGMSLYSQGKFKAAAPYLDYAVKQNAGNSTAYYYAAMAYHQLGMRNQAISYYRQIMEKFPTSEASGRARTALMVLDPGYISRHAGTVGGANNTPDARANSAFSADFSKLPDQGRIYFQRQGGVLMVDAELNNRSTKMIFDTGAEGCLFGKNQLAQMGISPPQGTPQGKSHGVGSSKGQDMWIMNVDLKVGNIVRKNFPIGVQESLETEPLLGQTFFSDFTYTIDNGANSIAYVKKHIAQQKGSSQSKSGTTAQRDAYSVPFIREGKELIVNAEVNGKACKMIFDTGASGTAFSKYQLEKLGIPIPDDAEEGTGSGIGGATKSMMFNLSRIKLGPIDKSALRISVPEQASLPRPLLGQNFYGDWQYTIENTSPSEGYIKFMRR